MAENKKLSWERDFTEFLAIKPAQIPNEISQQVIDQIHLELHPSAFTVFGKILIIQFAVGLVTLLFCPQFGVSLTSNNGIMTYLMKYGESVCMLGCGAVFTALSFFVASFALKPEEVRTLKQHEVLQLVSLAVLSLGAFIYIGDEIVLTLGLIWLFGAVIGGVVTLETGWALRQNLARRVAA